MLRRTVRAALVVLVVLLPFVVQAQAPSRPDSKLDVSGMDIFLIENGKIREIWVNMDSLTQAQQMGTVPVP